MIKPLKSSDNLLQIIISSRISLICNCNIKLKYIHNYNLLFIKKI